ncbi:CoA transferase [Spiractinospora alimapuensis]|uniref:CaiB/BaiF CoA transferase family protein n=1 Tax=Spiractinospora alimapuensis TaxID=2820884 RepID=UPI001F41ABC1|nr:CoA transferase [Spiractinospora alimapuensis]QVQ53825.1 CoA transferase [Spiractinospora alimapuensis]
MSALSGIRVLDFSQVLAGPFAAMLLADLDAEVVKVEPPAHGDHSRQMAPRVQDGLSGAYLAVNRNKRGVALDLKDERGRALAHQLAAQADVVIENFRPGVAARLGIDYATLAALNPRLVHCSISGFGQTGPYSSRGGFDLVAQGMTGLMSVTGDPDGAPAKCGIPVTDLATGLFAVYGILAALNARERTGRGQQVDASLFDTGIGLAVWEAVEYFHTGKTPGRTGSAHRLGAPYQAFRTSDGYFTVGADGDRHWPRFCEVIGLPRLPEDPRFTTNDDRLANREALVAAIEERTTTRTRDEWLTLLEEVGVPAGPINSVPEALSDPHTQARDMVVDVEHETLGTVRTLGPIVKLSDTPATIQSPAPGLGEHSTEVLTRLGVDESTISALRNEGVIA